MFEDAVWQMSRGERAAIEGVLAQLTPALAIEIGSMEGACLRRIADHAGEVHSFDLTAPSLVQPDNVILHTGDSHELLAPFLAELVEQERGVDLVLVDGDHSPEGVRRDIEDLLESRAVARTVILIHDTANERVRQGVDAVRFAAWPKVAHVELDWIPGRLFAEPALRNELWFGLGLVIVDVERPAYLNGSVYEQRYHPAGPLLAEIRGRMREREQVPPGAQSLRSRAETLSSRVAELEVALSGARTAQARLRAEVLTLAPRLTGAERALANVTGSASWKLTQPLRGAKRRVARRHRSG